MLALSMAASAKISIPVFLTDSMVVQQNDTLRIIGRSTSGPTKIVTSWSGDTVCVAPAADGSFAVDLPTPAAGGPYEITIGDRDSRRTLHHIYSGEVWLCSGQSNMEMPVGGWGKVMNYREEIAGADRPDVHLLQIAKRTAFVPADDALVNMGGWRTATPATVENFSAIAYFFARRLADELGVHVGVVDCDWGGTPAEAWTSLAGVKTIAGFENEVAMIEQSEGDERVMDRIYEQRLADWFESIKETPFDPAEDLYHSEWATMPVPCAWEESVLPGFDGIVWLQCKADIPVAWAGKNLSLRLGMIDDEDITYFNGCKIAAGSGYNTPRCYTVPGSLVKPGEAVISVRVSDFGGGGGILGEAAGLSLSEGDETLPLAGEWAYRIAADFAQADVRPASVHGSSFPTVLYNAMIHPLSILPFKGVLWYQGCANVGRDEQYSPLFLRMIGDWRELWQRPDMPFYFVQLAGYLKPQSVQPDSEWAALRQAQADALVLPHTAMVSAIDLGDPDDIHPKNKQEVGLRLCNLALRHSYGRDDIVADAPTVKRCKLKGSKAEIIFDGEVSAEGVPAGFIVKSPDGKWSRPEVKVTGKNRVSLSSPAKIVELKYNWADYPDGNLRGKTGLPVTPFVFK